MSKYEPEPDLMARAVRCPLDLDYSTRSMLVLRVRSKPWIASAAVHVSVDGQSYLQIADSIPHVVGAKLLEPLSATDVETEDGPLVQILGPDVSLLRVLANGDWRIGRQVMLIEDEWVFFREVEAVSKDAYQLRGLLRGQYDSEMKDHAAGVSCFLSDIRHLVPIQDASVRTGKRLWIKTQPYSGKPLSLAFCEATECMMTRPPERQ